MNAVLDQTLEEIEREDAERKSRAVTTFWTMAHTIARKKKPPADTAKILSESGKTTTDLREAVATVEQRLAWAEQIAAFAGLASERAALISKHDAGLKAFQEAQAKFEEIRNATLPRLSEIEQAEIAAGSADSKLANSCPYEHIIEQLNEVGAKIMPLTSRIGQLERLIPDARGRAKTLRGEHWISVGSAGNSPGAIAERHKQADRLLAEADAAERELPQLRKDLEPLRAEEARLIESCKKP